MLFTVMTIWSMRSMSIVSVLSRSIDRRERLHRGGVRVQKRGIECRHGRIACTDEHRDLRAAENDSARAAFDEVVDDPPILGARCVDDSADAKLVVDDPMNRVPISRDGYDDVESVQLFKSV